MDSSLKEVEIICERAKLKAEEPGMIVNAIEYIIALVLRVFGSLLRILCLLVLAVLALGIASKPLAITYKLDVNAISMDNRFYNTVVLPAVLAFADDNDTVILGINSPGGYVSDCITMINSIKASRAYTISVNKYMAASAGGLISMATKEQKANHISIYMFHRPYYLLGGVYKVLVKKDDLSYQLTQKYMVENVFPHFTQAQIDTYNSGKDVWIFGGNLIKQIKVTGSATTGS